ncbi:MAG: hypothetical protein U1E62_21630 [Alsobacter sp.]
MSDVPKFLFIDDAVNGGDADRYWRLLDKAGELSIEPRLPERSELLVSEAELPEGINGFIVDINLKDRVVEGRNRFIGTGAGLAQDLRLLQAVNGPDGQRPRPIVRLCAAQVFQSYLAGDDSTADIFDLGFAKETIGDGVGQARQQIASLPDLYLGVIQAAGAGSARDLLGLDEVGYARLHSAFRSALEFELTRKPHEAASFFIRYFLESPGLLIDEALLAIRLGVNPQKSSGWELAKQRFADAIYTGRAAHGFPRWWSDKVLGLWAHIAEMPIYRLTATERVDLLRAAGLESLVPIEANAYSPGNRPWLLSRSDDPALQLPADPEHAYPLTTATKPWLDEAVWCREQAKRERRSPLLSPETQARLARDLKRGAST